MIVKKIRRKGIDDSAIAKSSYVKTLTSYITDGGSVSESNKVEYWSGRGFLSTDLAGMQAEMTALAHASARSAQPVTHWVLSWKEQEQPTVEDIEVCVTTFLQELRLADHQVIYALHSPTTGIPASVESTTEVTANSSDGDLSISPMHGHSQNSHLHLAINRVHPLTNRAVKAGGGLDIDAAHRAIARIEALQGWQPEAHARYAVHHGQVVRSGIPAPVTRDPTQVQRDAENRTGQMSAQRLAAWSAGPLIRSASSWEALHASLRAHGFAYRKTGSGAVIFVGDIAVKASSVDRAAALGKLQKRLGPYEPDSDPSPVCALSVAVPVAPGVRNWGEYIKKRKAHYEQKRSELALLNSAIKTQSMALKASHFGQRRDILGGNWRGSGHSLNALRSALAAEQARATADLKDAHRAERLRFSEKFPPFPGYEDWLRQQGLEEDAELWRHRHSAIPTFIGADKQEQRPRDIRSYTSQVKGRSVLYYQDGNAFATPSFVDHGREVGVIESLNEGAVLAAMQLSAQKFGKFSASGNPDFLRLCVRLAAQHGFQLANDELQVELQLARENLRQLRHTSSQSKAAKPHHAHVPAAQPPSEPGDSPHISGTSKPVSNAETHLSADPVAQIVLPAGLSEILKDSTNKGVQAYSHAYQTVMCDQRMRVAHLSRVDAQIALHMRAANCTRAEIEKAIALCAQRIRDKPQPQAWDVYAKVATAYAWSVPGQRSLPAQEARVEVHDQAAPPDVLQAPDHADSNDQRRSSASKPP